MKLTPEQKEILKREGELVVHKKEPQFRLPLTVWDYLQEYYQECYRTTDHRELGKLLAGVAELWSDDVIGAALNVPLLNVVTVDRTGTSWDRRFIFGGESIRYNCKLRSTNWHLEPRGRDGYSKPDVSKPRGRELYSIRELDMFVIVVPRHFNANDVQNVEDNVFEPTNRPDFSWTIVAVPAYRLLNKDGYLARSVPIDIQREYATKSILTVVNEVVTWKRRQV